MARILHAQPGIEDMWVGIQILAAEVDHLGTMGILGQVRLELKVKVVTITQVCRIFDTRNGSLEAINIAHHS